jgi:hypothetical protein
MMSLLLDGQPFEAASSSAQGPATPSHTIREFKRLAYGDEHCCVGLSAAESPTLYPNATAAKIVARAP